MSDISTQATVNIDVNNKPAGRKIAELENKMDGLVAKKRQFEATGDQKGLVRIQKEINKVSRQLDNARTASARCQAALAKLNETSPKELRNTLRQLKSDLDHMERGSKAWNAQVEAIKRVKAEIKLVDAELHEHESMLSRINRKVNEWGMSVASATAGFTGLIFTARQAVQAYADMEGEMANVRKFTGMSAEEVGCLNEAFKSLDTRTSREDLNKLAQEAGRLGLQSEEDVLGFVTAANQINVALDDLGEGATLTLSKLTDIFGDKDRLGVEQSLLSVGSVINELSQNCTASAPYLAQFAQRLAGVGKQANMTIPEIMGFAAVLDSQGQAVEMSATALSQLIMKLFQDPAKIAKATGMDLQAFNKVLQEDTNDALLMLLERLHELGDISVLAPVFDAMGTDGARASQVIAALAGNVDAVKRQQLEANKAFKQGTSVTKEYNVQNNTVQAQLDKAKKGFHEMAVELGEKLAPVIKYAISGTSAMMHVLSTTVTFLSDYAGTIISTAASYGIYVTATNAAIIVDKVKVFWNDKLIMSFKRLWATMAANPWGAVAVAIGVVIGLMIDLARRTDAVSAAEEALNDVRQDAQKKIVDEQTELEILIDAANDTTQSYKDQKAAVDKLNKTIPGFNGKIDATTRAFSYSKQALDNYINSLIRLYEVEGAKEKFKELGKERAGYVMEKKQVEKEIEEEKKRQREQNQQIANNPHNYATTSGGMAPAVVNVQGSNAATLRGLEARLDSVNKKLQYTDAAMHALKAEYGKDWYAQDKGKPGKPDSKISGGGSGGSGGHGAHSGSGGSDGGSSFTPPDEKAERKAEQERKKKEREARAAQRKKEQDAAKAKRLADRVAKQEYKQALDDTVKDRANAENEALKLYKSGELGYYEYLDKMAKIEEEFWNSRLDTYEAFGKAESDEYAKDAKKLEEAKSKHEQQLTQIQVTAAQQRRGQAKLDAEMEYYNQDNKEAFHNQRWLDDRRAKLELDYLQEVMKIHKEGSKEWLDAEKALDKAVKEEELRQRKQLETDLSAWLYIYSQRGAKERMEAELRVAKELYDKKLLKEEEYQEAVKAIQDKYRDEVNGKTGTKAKNQDFTDAADTYNKQLAALEDARKQGLISQEDYESRRWQIIQSYHGKIVELVKGEGDEWGSMVANLVETWKAGVEDLGSTLPEKLKTIGDMAAAAFAVMNAGIKSYTDYANASRDLEVKKAEASYDAQIKAAGGNEKKQKKLEEEKQKEIAKIKTKYDKQAMVIEMAQAVASTAMGAINAYASAAKIPAIGYILAPIAASMALAAGALQIATIKKSHQTQQMGYYEGGFTGRDGDNRREVGVVHANEFVANHQAVANPELMPVLRLIDQAQRNNTIGSLTSEDVSRAIGQGAILGDMTVNQQRTADREDRSMQLVAASMEQQTAAINELNARLADGIESFMVMDGERGFDRSWQRYQRMKNNPRR